MHHVSDSETKREKKFSILSLAAFALESNDKFKVHWSAGTMWKTFFLCELGFNKSSS